jgi:putative ABC transport system ATP-binding protein
MTNGHPLLELRGLGKSFGKGPARVKALANVNLDVNPGEVMGLMGPSGYGKSTLLNLIGCILESSTGMLSLEGQQIWNERWKQTGLRRLRLEKIGYIFQFNNLLPYLNAWENVALVRTLLGDSRNRAKERTLDLLDYLQLSRLSAAMPSQLSGGEAQRIAIARALANEARIILSDEQTTAPTPSAPSPSFRFLFQRSNCASLQFL